MRWFKANAAALAFVLINFAVAAPVEAGLDNDLCGGSSNPEPCCTTCYIFCHCDWV